MVPSHPSTYEYHISITQAYSQVHIPWRKPRLSFLLGFASFCKLFQSKVSGWVLGRPPLEFVCRDMVSSHPRTYEYHISITKTYSQVHIPWRKPRLSFKAGFASFWKLFQSKVSRWLQGRPPLKFVGPDLVPLHPRTYEYHISITKAYS
jgi:hypothetical protein